MTIPPVQFIRLPSKSQKTSLVAGFWEGLVLVFDEHLSPSYLKAKKVERLISKITKIVLLVIGILGLAGILLTLFLNRETLVGISFKSLSGIVGKGTLVGNFFIFTLLTDLYLVAEMMRSSEMKKKIRHLPHDQDLAQPPMLKVAEDLKTLPKKTLVEIDESFSDQTLRIVNESYRLARRFSRSGVEPIHLIIASIGFDGQVQNVIDRLGLQAQELFQKLLRQASSLPQEETPSYLSDSSYSVFIKSYASAAHQHLDYLDPLEVFLEAFLADTASQEVLYDYGISKEDVANAVAWQRINRRLYDLYLRYKSVGKLRSKTGIDRAMTSLATPFLNNVSQDLTRLAQLGNLELHVGREAEFEAMYRLFESGNKNVILIGEPGVGKSALVEGLAEKIIGDDVPEIFREKRLVSVSISKLLSGASSTNANDRLYMMFNDILQAGNVILYIDNIQDIYGVGVGEQGLDMASVLAELLARNQVYTILATTQQEYRKTIESSVLGNTVRPLKLEELSAQDSILVLESKVGFVEQKSGVRFTYQALKAIAEFADRYIHDQNFPQKAIVVMEEVGSFVRQRKGQGALVERADVAVLLTEKLHIPISDVTTGESDKLLKLEEILHQRVIGQDEAVVAVATALRRSRAELRDIKRPIASMLFLGPTGVGKTELTKAIAEAYFGAESSMIRLDMSEFQNQADLYKMIGSPPGTGGNQRGLLTEAVRKNPFTIVLLDELEKAHPDILNIFLQVMEDGRLTDAQGFTADFTNAIIIATSNASTPFVQQEITAGTPIDQIKQKLMAGELAKSFRPEFINRFDAIVLFKPLTFEDVVKVARLMVNGVVKNMEKKGIAFKVSDEALVELAQKGFDPLYGARPLRRVIQDQVDNALANFLLTGKLGRRDVVTLDVGGVISVQKAEAL